MVLGGARQEKREDRRIARATFDCHRFATLPRHQRTDNATLDPVGTRGEVHKDLAPSDW